MKYNRNINMMKFPSIEKLYDSVNNDPKRPGYQVVYLTMGGEMINKWNNTLGEWRFHLLNNGYHNGNISYKYPIVDGINYTMMIIPATEEEVLALKITF